MATILLIPQPDESIQQITLDAVTDRVHDSQADITDQAVENGSDTSDHIRAKPETLSLDIVLTDQHIIAYPDFNEGATADVGKIQLTKDQGALVLKHSKPTERSKRVHEELLRCQSEGVLIDVISTKGRFRSMGVLGVSLSESHGKGKGWFIKLDLKRVRIAKTQTASSSVPRLPRGRGGRSAGSQRGQQDSEGQNGNTETNRSFLRRLTSPGG